MDEHDIDHEEMKRLLRENQRLLLENNQLLKLMRRRARLATIFNLLWIGFLIGAPLALYYFILEPNIETLRRSIEVIEAGARNTSGFQELFDSFREGPQ